jgi:hypothetical protein
VLGADNSRDTARDDTFVGLHRGFVADDPRRVLAELLARWYGNDLNVRSPVNPNGTRDGADDNDRGAHRVTDVRGARCGNACSRPVCLIEPGSTNTVVDALARNERYVGGAYAPS